MHDVVRLRLARMKSIRSAANASMYGSSCSFGNCIGRPGRHVDHAHAVRCREMSGSSDGRGA